MSDDLKEGDVVLVRMEVRSIKPSDTGSMLCRLHIPLPSSHMFEVSTFSYFWVPPSQIVGRETDAGSGRVRADPATEKILECRLTPGGAVLPR